MSHYVCVAQLDSADIRSTRAQWTVFSSGNSREAIVRRGPSCPMTYHVGDETTAELIVGTFFEEVLAARGIKYYDNKFYLEPKEEYLLGILMDLIKYETTELLKSLTNETVVKTAVVKTTVEVEVGNEEPRSESSWEETHGKIKELETNYYKLMRDSRKIKQELSELRTLIRTESPSIVVSSYSNQSSSEPISSSKYVCPNGRSVDICACKDCSKYKRSSNWCGNMECPMEECNCEYHDE